ncbi:IclR family transcriptional regulator [Phytomonospora endophytica]|uniref:DNA-binding IclR family transcriptional regulator n=1 Tax=Phytomonospora endophytica TaxID=714109 RepID=A0A841FZ93_9ACTN|nr:helix-turn-helix domain-containing protein [Phytomonospora endophytica]MBB6038677.1 DNA-binding IclR family transcriptional regulator [Phytomonospora endophytica]GIG69178.1 putative transcriptional regulator, IclR family protein [Phytomonospora endophytica]
MRVVEGESSTVIGRSLAILEVIGSTRRPLSLSEIARGARLPKTTTLRLLGTLVEHRVVMRGHAGYGLGSRLQAAIEGAHTVGRRLRRLLMPYLLELHRVTGLTVSLGVLNYYEVHFVETLLTHRQFARMRTTGEPLPAHRTASGKAILAYNPEALARLADLAEYDELVEETVLIRGSGLAHTDPGLASGLQGVAAPIFARSGVAVAAISIGGMTPTDLIGQEAVAALRRVAHAASVEVRRSHRRRPSGSRQGAVSARRRS